MNRRSQLLDAVGDSSHDKAFTALIVGYGKPGIVPRRSRFLQLSEWKLGAIKCVSIDLATKYMYVHINLFLHERTGFKWAR